MNAEFVKKIVEAKKLFKPISYDKTGNFKNKYASIDAIMQSIFEGLSSQGLSVHFSNQTIDLYQKPWLLMTAHLTDGVNELTTSIQLPLDKALSSPNPIQQIGSNLTYGRRYTVSCLLNLTADDDLDGQNLEDREEKPARELGERPSVIKPKVEKEEPKEKTHREYVIDISNYIKIHGRSSVASTLNILEDDIEEIKSWNLKEVQGAVEALYLLLGPLQKS